MGFNGGARTCPRSFDQECMSCSKIISYISQLIAFLSFLGLFVHSYLVIKDYLNYNAVNSISIRLKEDSPTPGVTICFPTLWILPIELLWRYESATVEEIANSIPNITKYVVPEKEKYVYEMEFRNRVGFTCLKVVKIVNDNLRDKYFEVKLRFTEFALSQTKLIFLFFLHDRDNHAYSPDSYPLYYYLDLYTHDMDYSFTYDIISKLMTPPFADNCYNYKKFKSRGHCYSKCHSEVLFEFVGYDFSDFDDISYTYYNTSTNNKLILPPEYILQIAKSIFDLRCPMKCNTSSFYPIYVRQHTNDDDLFILRVTRARPQTTISSSAELSVRGLIAYLAGVVGIWTSFNALALSSEIKDFFDHKLKSEKVDTIDSIASRYGSNNNSELFDLCSRISRSMNNMKEEISILKSRMIKLENMRSSSKAINLIKLWGRRNEISNSRD